MKKKTVLYGNVFLFRIRYRVQHCFLSCGKVFVLNRGFPFHNPVNMLAYLLARASARGLLLVVVFEQTILEEKYTRF